MNEYHIITIEREYASGGREIGKILAQKLGVPFYGNEILQMAAERTDTTPEYLEHLEETATNSLLYSLYMMASASSGGVGGLSSADRLSLVEGEIIKEIAAQGDCVIVGRCAGWLLRERTDCFNVFIHSDPALRRKRAVECYGIDPKRADSVLRRFDKRRSNFYNANSNRSWKDITGYHMVLDSGRLGVSACADIIAEAVRQPRK